MVVVVEGDTTSAWWAFEVAMRRRGDHGVVEFVGVVASGAGNMDVWGHGTAAERLVDKKGTTAGDSAGKEASWAPWAAGSRQDSQGGESSEEEDVRRACRAYPDEVAWGCAARRHRAFADSFFRNAEQAWHVGDCLSISTRAT